MKGCSSLYTPVDVGEAKLAQALLAHLKQVGEAQLPVRTRLTPHLCQVRCQRAPESRRPSLPACSGLTSCLLCRRGQKLTSPMRWLSF